MPAAAPCARKHATYTRALRRLVGLALARRRQPRAHAMRAVACICIHPPTMILRLGPRQRARTRARAPHAAEEPRTPPPRSRLFSRAACCTRARTRCARVRACVRTGSPWSSALTTSASSHCGGGDSFGAVASSSFLCRRKRSTTMPSCPPARTHARLLPRRAARDHATRAWAGLNFGEVRWEGRGVARASAGLWLREAWIANAPQGDTRCWRHRRRKGQRACSRSQESTGVNVGVDACERASERACSRLVLLSRDSFS